MKAADFYKLFQRQGGYSLPLLIELYHPDTPKGTWLFTNASRDVEWEGKTWRAVPMSYKPPSTRAGIPSGGSLEIDIGIEGHDVNLLGAFDTWDDRLELIVQAVIFDDGIQKIGQLDHRYGTLSWDGEKITWNLGEDDRLQMQINPWKFDPELLID